MQFKPLLIILFPIVMFGQNSSSIYKDFNNDGFVDSLLTINDTRNGFGFRLVRLTNGKTNEKFKLDNIGYFCDIKQIILIPPDLRKECNKSFLESIKKELLPEKKNVPDASLQWLINANVNHKTLSNNIYYDLVIYTPTKWILGNKIELPSTYYIDIKGNDLHQLYFTDSELPKWYDSVNNEGCLVYYGHNHFRNLLRPGLVLVDSTPIIRVYQTSHRLVLAKNNSYAWIFISDYRLTGGPEKLRWESIAKVKIIGNYAIIQTNTTPDVLKPVFIIDIEKGICGRLKSELTSSSQFEIDKENLRISINGESISFELKTLFEELVKTKN